MSVSPCMCLAPALYRPGGTEEDTHRARFRGVRTPRSVAEFARAGRRRRARMRNAKRGQASTEKAEQEAEGTLWVVYDDGHAPAFGADLRQRLRPAERPRRPFRH